MCDELVGDDDKRNRNEERHQRLDLAMPVWMLFIGGSRPVAYAKDYRKVRHEVGNDKGSTSHHRGYLTMSRNPPPPRLFTAPKLT